MLKLKKNVSCFGQKRLINKNLVLLSNKLKLNDFNIMIQNIKNIEKKRKKISVNKLLNSSKFMIRDNSQYKSCFNNSRNSHFYPYKPFSSTGIRNKFLTPSPENSKNISSKILFKFDTIESNKDSPKINRLTKKKLYRLINPISSRTRIISPLNKYILDNNNIFNSFKKINNNIFKNTSYISEKNDFDINFLNNSLKNISLNQNLFINNIEKKSSLEFDSLKIFVKLSSLSIKFYELTNKINKNMKINLYDNILLNIDKYDNKISKIKFPFEFLYFFLWNECIFLFHFFN